MYSSSRKKIELTTCNNAFFSSVSVWLQGRLCADFLQQVVSIFAMTRCLTVLSLFFCCTLGQVCLFCSLLTCTWSYPCPQFFFIINQSTLVLELISAWFLCVRHLVSDGFCGQENLLRRQWKVFFFLHFFSREKIWPAQTWRLTPLLGGETGCIGTSSACLTASPNLNSDYTGGWQEWFKLKSHRGWQKQFTMRPHMEADRHRVTVQIQIT